MHRLFRLQRLFSLTRISQSLRWLALNASHPLLNQRRGMSISLCSNFVSSPAGQQSRLRTALPSGTGSVRGLQPCCLQMDGLLMNSRLVDAPILAMCCFTKNSASHGRRQALLLPGRHYFAAFAPANLPAAFSHCMKRELQPRLRASAGEAVPSNVAAVSSAVEGSLKTLNDAVVAKDAEAVKNALDQLAQEGWAKQWSSMPNISRRTTFIRELSSIGIKNAENLAIPSVRNDAAFLFTVVGVTSVLAVAAGQLPGDWGFFVPYLIGSVSLVVLAIGSIAPGLLQAGTDAFSSVFSDYKERVLRHEAAHFLVAYLVGLPIIGYSLDLGNEHVNLIDEKLQKRIYTNGVDSKELDRLAVVSMAGLAAEGLKYDKVVGQSADLFSLQRLINRSQPKLSNDQQQNLTRWAVLYAATLLKNNSKSYEALMDAMAQKASVSTCIEAIEKRT